MEHNPLDRLADGAVSPLEPLEGGSPFEEDSPFDEEMDNASQPSVSVSDRPGTSQEENAWPEVEDSR